MEQKPQGLPAKLKSTTADVRHKPTPSIASAIDSTKYERDWAVDHSKTQDTEMSLAGRSLTHWARLAQTSHLLNIQFETCR